PHAGSDDREEPAELLRLADLRKISDVALQDRRRVGPEPGGTTIRARPTDDLRVASAQSPSKHVAPDVRMFLRASEPLREEGVDEAFPFARELALREWPKREMLAATSERLRDRGEQEHVRGAGQHEHPGTAICVDTQLDLREQLGDVLDLVEDDRSRVAR